MSEISNEVEIKKYIDNEEKELRVGKYLKKVNVSTSLTKNQKINSQKLHEIEYRINEMEGDVIKDCKIKIIFKLPYVPQWLDSEFIKIYQTSNGTYLHPGYKMNYNVKISKNEALEKLDGEVGLSNSEKLFALMYFTSDLELLKFPHCENSKVNKNKKIIVNSANCEVAVGKNGIKYHHNEAQDMVTMIKQLHKNYISNIEIIRDDETLSFLSYNIFRPDKITDGVEELALLHHIHNNNYINILKNPLNRNFYYRLYIYSKMKSSDVLKYINGDDARSAGDFKAFFYQNSFEEEFGDYYKNYKNYDFLRSHFEKRFFYFGDVVNIKSNKNPTQNIDEVIQYITYIITDAIDEYIVDINNPLSIIRTKHYEKDFRLLGDYIYSTNTIRGNGEKYLADVTTNHSDLELDNYYLLENPHIMVMLYKARNSQLSFDKMLRLIDSLIVNAFMDNKYWLRKYNYSLDYIVFLILQYNVPIDSYSQILTKLGELYSKNELTDTRLHVFFTHYDPQMPVEWLLELNSNRRKTDQS